MKYDAKEKILRLSAEELVLTAFAHYEKEEVEHFPPELAPGKEDGTKTVVFSGFAVPAFSGEMEAKAYLQQQKDGTLLAFRRFLLPRALGKERRKTVLRLLRGLGFALCYAFAGEGVSCFRFALTDEDGNAECLEEQPSPEEIERFFYRLLSGLITDADREIERVTVRMPSFLSVPFPYADVREGQKEMMNAVYAAARGGETLFAAAPTGTGKTMAVLFPALRAMGHGHIRKIFYLTPKNTSALAATEAVKLLVQKGMHLRALHLVAKERICADRSDKGECGACRRRAMLSGKLSAAVEFLVASENPVVGERALAECAGLHGVCPYRLALAYGKYADLIIGDYNYLFDTHVAPDALFPKDEERFFLIDEAHNLPDRAREMFSGGLDNAFFEEALSLYPTDSATHTALGRLYRGFLKTTDRLLQDELRQNEAGEWIGFAKSANFPQAFATLLAEETATLVKEKADPADPAAKEKKRVLHTLTDFLEKLAHYDGRFLTYAERKGEERRLCFFCIDPSGRVEERLSLGRGAVFFSATLAPLDYYRSVLCGGRRTSKIEVPSPFESGSLCVGIMDKISVRASEREETLPEIAKVIVTAMKPRVGNYMVFCPSYDYMEAVAEAFHKLTPKTAIAVQKRQMTAVEREAFLANFTEDGNGYFVGFCVSGGIFSEGVDLVGKRLIGTVVIGVGLPGISAERELIASYYGDLQGEGKEYAYLYPGLNRILQAAGRVIRREEDRGVAVLIDDRLRDPACRRAFPQSWRGLKYVGDRPSLSAFLSRFWENVDKENVN